MNIIQNELFLEPKTTQYGSHMVMTNVNKPTKSKYINIDTRFCEEYNYREVSNYNVTIPERITNVKNITILSSEIPMFFYNISANLGNNVFSIVNSYTKTVIPIKIPDNQYTIPTLISEINTLINVEGITVSVNNMNRITFTANSPLTIQFDVDKTGDMDKNNFKYKLGWLLGFRQPSYTLTNSATSESVCNITGSQYLYIAVDEFKGIHNSFITPLPFGLINKHILARITLDFTRYAFGTVLPANRMNGLLVSDLRSYNGTVDLQKLNISLLNELGNPVVLNGQDFSFCLKVDYE
jgi:hypothetical protein